MRPRFPSWIRSRSGHVRARVVARDRHHEAQVRLDEPPARDLVALVLAPGELALLGRRQKPAVADRPNVELQRVLKRLAGLDLVGCLVGSVE
jgi:hypothetical protein